MVSNAASAALPAASTADTGTFVNVAVLLRSPVVYAPGDVRAVPVSAWTKTVAPQPGPRVSETPIVVSAGQEGYEVNGSSKMYPTLTLVFETAAAGNDVPNDTPRHVIKPSRRTNRLIAHDFIQFASWSHEGQGPSLTVQSGLAGLHSLACICTSRYEPMDDLANMT